MIKHLKGNKMSRKKNIALNQLLYSWGGEEEKDAEDGVEEEEDAEDGVEEEKDAEDGVEEEKDAEDRMEEEEVAGEESETENHTDSSLELDSTKTDTDSLLESPGSPVKRVRNTPAEGARAMPMNTLPEKVRNTPPTPTRQLPQNQQRILKRRDSGKLCCVSCSSRQMSCSHVAKYKEWCEDWGVDSNHVFADSSEANLESVSKSLVPYPWTKEMREQLGRTWCPTYHLKDVSTDMNGTRGTPWPNSGPSTLVYASTLDTPTSPITQPQMDSDFRGWSTTDPPLGNAPAAKEDLSVVTESRHSERVFIDCARSRRLLLWYSGKVSSGKSSGKSKISDTEMKDLRDKLDRFLPVHMQNPTPNIKDSQAFIMERLVTSKKGALATPDPLHTMTKEQMQDELTYRAKEQREVVIPDPSRRAKKVVPRQVE
ncbi:Hypp8279 [Branchiostoma lanceolatum]|uniref:Hypp8279 protein n=1 Tax=Branchiostoma lanceolatum TaxID=7740 RepID=A0A8J9Z7P5_BRALA|nr:Hypp8279 [Branchiostoma lanceolatum]